MNDARVRIALVATSPAHYRAPLYRRIAADPRVDFTAIFAARDTARPEDYGVDGRVDWGVDELDGFPSRFLRRAERNRLDGSFLSLRDLDVVPQIVRGRYDVLWLHGYYSLTHVLAACAQKLRRRPVLFREVQTMLHPRPPLKRLVKRVALRWLFRGAVGLYVGTESRRWFAHYGVRDERLFFVPNCVDNERLREQAKALEPVRNELRRSFGITPDGGPVILTVGRLVAKKQPLHLLEAFRRVREHRRCTLLIAGSGPLEAELRAEVERHSIPDVVFAGFLDQNEVARAYACADVFVLASKEHETWGLVVNEAMNFGLPIVVTDKVGCAADLVRAGENGFVVGVDDVAALAASIGTLADEPELRRAYGEASRRIVRGWEYDVACRGIIDAVAAALGPDRRPSVEGAAA